MIIDSIFSEEEVKVAKKIKYAKYMIQKISKDVRYLHGEYDSISIESHAHPDDVNSLRKAIEDIDESFTDLHISRFEKKNKKDC